MNRNGKNGKAAAQPADARASGPGTYSQKRETALEGVRARIKNVGVPPRIRSKRNRSANRETR